MTEENLKEKLSTMIEDNFHNAFWDKLEEDLKENNHKMLLDLLDEIRMRICNFVPNRKDIHTEVYEKIDVKFIEQMLTHNAIDNKYIYDLINYIITQIRDFDSEEVEPNYEMWRTVTNSHLEKETKLYILLPKFLREVFFRIDSLDDFIESFKQSEEYKILTENKQD